MYSRRLARRGLTLLELLIVLVIMSVGAGLVVFNRGGVLRTADAELITRVRRMAVTRAEPLALFVGVDGRWVLRGTGGAELEHGEHGGEPLAVQIDPLGSCRPLRADEGQSRRVFDPLTCRMAAAAP